MKNYVEFTIEEKTAKAYTTLENIYEIENSGVNLSKVFFNMLNSGEILSFTVARKILDIAIKADITDFKARAEFIKLYFDKKRFKACDEVTAFVIEAVKTPSSDTEDSQEESEDEKK
jgi:hypothetical protein